MSVFHETTSTILKYVLAEQRRDLMLTEKRLEQADESTLKTDVERERFSRTVAKSRAQITEFTAVVADFERLVQHVEDENAEAAELEQARAEVAAAVAAGLFEQPDPVHAAAYRRSVDAATEAFVDVADAERYALRDDYVNAADNVKAAPAPVFAADDLVNISDPTHKLFGTRGVVVGSLYPDGVVVEYDNHGNTVTVTASQLMHHTEFVKQPDEFFAAAERTTLAEQLRARGAEQAEQDAEADAFHAQRRADEAEANGEHVDYAEAEAVREIRELMDLDAAGVESWDQL